MSVVTAGVLPLEEVAGQNLSATAKEIFPYGIYVIFILGGAVFAIANSVMAFFAQLRHPIQQIAEDGWLPAVFKKTTKGGYPYVSQGIFYLIAILPVLLNFSVDAIVSLVMIPLMLLNICMNFLCIGLVKKYPRQWEKSILHMPYGVFVMIMLLSCICAAIVAYNLFAMLVLREMVIAAGLIVFCFVVAVIRLKTGAVDVKNLEAQRQAIIEEALIS